MTTIYAKQKKFFRKAYETGDHGWPETGPTPQVARLVKKLGSGRGQTALDLGCGEGRHTILLARTGYEVTAFDLEPLALEKARAALRRSGLKAGYKAGDALDPGFDDGAFDLVLDYGCFHHVVTRDWPRYRRQIARILKPGGHLILSVFSTKFRHHPKERRTRNWIVHRNHYDHFFSPTEIRRAFAPAFQVRTLVEELEGLNGFYHVLLRKL
jgi:SAM-dependent methyltransferase